MFEEKERTLCICIDYVTLYFRVLLGYRVTIWAWLSCGCIYLVGTTSFKGLQFTNFKQIDQQEYFKACKAPLA